MKPGRELDTLVAEKVMGLKEDYLSCPTCKYDGVMGGLGYLPYSTDITAAWLVVEKMHTHPKPVLQLAAPQQDFCNERWRAEFSRKWWHEGSPYEYACNGETAAHAICLAALHFFKDKTD